MLPQCRICFETDSDHLISPCQCTGTIRYVHRECLQIWRKTLPLVSHNNFRDIRCEMCHTNYQFEDELPNFKYCKSLIVLEMVSFLIIIHLFGFMFGMVLTGFGEITTMIAIKYINLYLYQYLLGNAIIHIIIGALALSDIARSENECFVCFPEDTEPFCCCIIYIIALVIGVFFTIIGVYYWSLERSKERQRVKNDNRRVKDLGHSLDAIH